MNFTVLLVVVEVAIWGCIAVGSDRRSSVHTMSGAGSGFAGLTDGSFFKAPGWVDLSKRPGESKQVPPTWRAWAANVACCAHVFYSPNFVWLSIAAVVWCACPYDLAAASEWRRGWMLRRLGVNFVTTFGYVGFWHTALYIWGWSRRKFMPNVFPDASRMLHNVFFSLLAVVQWTAWECVYMRGAARGTLPTHALDSSGAYVRLALWIVAIPLYRGAHFYFAHRLIHVKPLYKFVHSLHHRNIDIEPFAGLCMHPVEHLFYFSCVGPSLYCRAHPFVFWWNGVHLLLSPAASHSGWEDHLQSDQFHMLHHRRFECNYGSASFPLDHLFGTFRDRLHGSSKTYRGAGDAAAKAAPSKDGTVARAAEDATYPPMPKSPRGFYGYMAFVAVLFLGAAREAAAPRPLRRARAAAAALAFGPVVAAVILLRLVGDRSDLRWPFHREAAPTLGLHLGVGLLIGVVPVYHAMLSIHA